METGKESSEGSHVTRRIWCAIKWTATNARKTWRAINWTAVAALGSLASAIAALWIVQITVNERKEETAWKRPYFSHEDSAMVQAGLEGVMKWTFRNINVHPAAEVSIDTLVIDQELEGKAYDQSIAAAPRLIGAGEIRRIESLILRDFPENVPPQYIVQTVKYSDPIARKTFTQVLSSTGGGGSSMGR